MPSSQKIISKRKKTLFRLIRQTSLPIIIFAVLLITACVGTADPIPRQPTPTSTPSRSILPTETSIPTVIPTLITTIPPPETPFATPTTISVPEAVEPLQFPDPGQFEWQQIAGGFNSPIGLANAGDGSDRLFVIEQPGMIRVIHEGKVLDEPLLDIRGRISCCGERGLLGLAFHPRYLENGYFFVNYTDMNGNTAVSRFTVSDDPGRADASSETIVLQVDQPYANHNGGGIAFGTDGYLYIALGDGGSGGDPQGNAQNTNSLLGKLLRLDVNQSGGYQIPPDNPFAGGGGSPEIWAYGLRNPWRFSFDRLTGDMYIGDVGQGSREEIDFLPAGVPGGANFGWNYMEGSLPFGPAPDTDASGWIDPVAEYGRDQGFSVIGGVVYRGDRMPEWRGIYFYGDYGSGNIWGLYPSETGDWENRLLFQTGRSITSFGEDESGELYYVSLDGGLYKLAGK